MRRVYAKHYSSRQKVGRSSSTKKKEGSAGIRHAISFRRHPESEPGSQSQPVLQKAREFRQNSEGVVTPPPQESSEPVPDLPSAPPPEISRDSKSPLSKKDQLSPPRSPKQKHLDQLKSEDKKKRTPSFSLSKRTRSFKDKHRLPDGLPPAEMEGVLERKHELQTGGKKATIRKWKTYYAVLFGQLLCFFKDKEGMQIVYRLNLEAH